MSEQRTSWLRRLIGTDGAEVTTSSAIEQGLGRVNEEARQLSEQLEQERAQAAARARQLEELTAELETAQTQLAAVQLERQEDLKQKYAQLTSELETLQTAQQRLTDERNKLNLALTRQRDESSKLSKALAAAKDQLSQGEAALQASRQQTSELEAKLDAHGSEAQKARAQALELKQTADVRAMDLAEHKRKLQAAETRSSSLEQELAATRQAQQKAEAAAATLGNTARDYAKLEEAAARREADLGAASAQLGKERAQRDIALRMANDLWNALYRSVGEAAALALVLGVDTGHVELASNLGDATLALKRAFEDKALCQGIQVEPLDDGMQVELRSSQLSENGATAPWLLASATRFLEKAVGIELAIETSTVEQDRVTFRLQKSIDPRAAS